MNYQELRSSLVPKEEKKWRDYLTRRNLIIFGYVLLALLLVLSFSFNIFLKATSCQCQVKTNLEDQRMSNVNKDIQQLVYNETQIIKCKREFFLFHQDQNHVCEVVNIFITNDTKEVIVHGNELTTVLHIFSKEVYKIPEEIFKEFPSLKNLIVNGNHLQIIERTTFQEAKLLEVLRLSNNELVELNAHIFNMQFLKTLDLGRNRLERIASEAFSGLVALERLYLSDNNLKSIPSDIFYPLPKLSFLSLENNQFTKLDDDIFKNNPQMKSLGLSNNSFTELKNEIFHYFDNLTDLSVSELRILELDLNGTTVQTLVMRNTDLRNLTLYNFPKILVSFGTPLEFLQFIITENTADFNRLPNYGGIFFNKNVRFMFRFKREIATQENLEKYDNKVRDHIRLPELDYETSDGSKFEAVEYISRVE